MRVGRRYKMGAAPAVLLLVIAAQVFQPARTNPVVDETRTIQARTRMTPEMNAILERSCRDCHSYATTWPWYSRVAPVSWLLISHVNEGREHLNLSDWASYDAGRADHKLEEMCEVVRDGEMPMTSYTWAHAQAKLTADDVGVVCAWTKQQRALAAAPSPAVPAAAH